MHRLAGIFAALAILFGSFPPAAAQDKTLMVFAAASMKNALDDINVGYQDMRDGKNIRGVIIYDEQDW